MRRTIALALFGLAGAVVLAAHGQTVQTPPQQTPAPPRFGVVADIVEVDVSVLDRNRRPMRGLTAADFEVTEDKIVQNVTVFGEVTLSDPETTPPGWMREVPRDVESNRLGERRLVVLFVDDTKPLTPLQYKNGREAAHTIVNQLGPDDLAAIVFAANQRLSQDFTNDRARLNTTIDQYNFVYGQRPLRTLNLVLDALATVPNRRKTIFYLSAGEAFDPQQIAGFHDLYSTVPDKGERVTQSRLLLDELQELLRKARLGNVNVYAVDPSGLEAPDSTGFIPGHLQREFLATVSGETGGHATMNTNEPAREIPKLFKENSSYYLLGFTSTNKATDGHYRRLKVRVKKSGADVRVRSGYYAPTEAGQTTAPRQGALGGRVGQVLAGLVPNPDMPMSLSVVPFGQPTTGTGTLALIASLEAPLDAVGETVDVQMTVFTPEGVARGGQRVAVRLNGGTPTGDRIRFQAFGKVDLPPGKYRVRAAANMAARNLSGSIFSDAELTDFQNDPISLSGIVFETTPVAPSVPKDLLAPLMPVVPSTVREFGSAPTTVFARAYEGGAGTIAPVFVRVMVLDDKSGTEFNQAITLGPETFAGTRFSDIRLTLPGGLRPGPHLLQMTATAGEKTATRKVPFSVK